MTGRSSLPGPAAPARSLYIDDAALFAGGGGLDAALGGVAQDQVAHADVSIRVQAPCRKQLPARLRLKGLFRAVDQQEARPMLSAASIILPMVRLPSSTAVGTSLRASTTSTVGAP